MQSDLQTSQQDNESASKLDGIVLILLLFSCCALPLGLSALALLAAWFTNVPSFETYRPWLLAGAFVSGWFGWKRIYRPSGCGKDPACAVQRPGMGAKVLFWLAASSTGYVLSQPYLGRYFY